MARPTLILGILVSALLSACGGVPTSSPDALNEVDVTSGVSSSSPQAPEVLGDVVVDAQRDFVPVVEEDNPADVIEDKSVAKTSIFQGSSIAFSDELRKHPNDPSSWVLMGAPGAVGEDYRQGFVCAQSTVTNKVACAEVQADGAFTIIFEGSLVADELYVIFSDSFIFDSNNRVYKRVPLPEAAPPDQQVSAS